MAGTHYRRRHNSYYSKRRRKHRHHPYQPRSKASQQQLQQQQLQQQQQAQKEQQSSRLGMDDSDDDIHVPVPVPLLDVGITSWLPLPELSGAWRWCSDSILQSLDWVKDTIFPSRVYQRELQETKDHLMLLHQQIEQLKAHTLKAESDKPSQVCGCSCQCVVPTTTNKHLSLQSVRSNPTQGQQIGANGGVQARGDITSSAPAAPPSLPPPPPPLPPPPPPPPPPISQPTKPLVIRKSKAKGSSSQASTSKPQVMVTLSDIMNVKLKKVSTTDPKQPSIDPAHQHAVVTLTDIMNVQLRKTFRDRKSASSGSCVDSNDDLKAITLRRRRSNHKINDENATHKVLRSRISNEAVQFRGCLRKVNMVRSPGGTPLRSRNSRENHGTGLTPLMTKALHRKFKTIRTPSPSPTGIPAISPTFMQSS